MKEFKIYEKRFVWTRTNIINFGILFLILIIVFIVILSKIEKSPFLNILLLFILAFYFFWLFLKVKNLNRIQQIPGDLSKKLFFEKEFIEVDKERIAIENIKTIEITGVDWIGLKTSNYLLNYNYENGLSNGIRNYLILEYNDLTIEKIQFQRQYPCEFMEVVEIIKHYYINKKIGHLNCIDLLCLSDEQKNEFKDLRC